MNVKITNNPNEATLITHDAKFHPDDVFSTMFLSKFIENPVVYRASVRNIPEIKDAIIYDIGFGKFDHHGADARYRENSNIKYCSFGLLWEEYGRQYLDKIETEDKEMLYKAIEDKLVKQIDGIDNGLFYKIESPYSILDLDKIIDSFNNTWKEKTDNNENFLKAVSFAEIIFDNLLKKENSTITAIKCVEKKLENVEGNILILDEYMPYTEAIFNSKLEKVKNIKVVILPSNRGGYNIKPLTISKDNKDLIVNWPKEFLGKHDKELAQLSGVKTAFFMHATGFLASTETLEDAIKLANIAINYSENTSNL